MIQPIPRHAKHWCHQGAEILQGAEQDEKQDRASRHQYIPAEAPGGQQVGWVLEAEAAHLKRREQRGSPHRAHTGAVQHATPRLFMATSAPPTCR